MRCCATCIGDRHIRRHFIPDNFTTIGTCSYCGTENQHLVQPHVLRDAFELLLGIYNRDESGKELSHWMTHDWAMFDNNIIKEPNVKNLLTDILVDPEIAENLYTPSSIYQSNFLDRWNTFREELMHKNRYFPSLGIDLKRLNGLLPHLLLSPEEIPPQWFRVRIQDGKEPYPKEKMGPPPNNRATHGRANPPGIPYLYLASTKTTAIAEVRPHTGEMVSVAEFHVPEDLKIIDLATPRQTISPFALEDESEVGLLRAGIGFLERLGEELARPILPNSAAIDYTPSQFLCEFIKKCGYDGVQFKSSVGTGTNLAIFQAKKPQIQTISMHEVTLVSVEHKLFENT